MVALSKEDLDNYKKDPPNEFNCVEIEPISFNDAKPDPKIRLTNFDKQNASYFFDILDKMMG